MRGALSKLRLLAALAMTLIWVGLIVCAVRSYWKSDRIALESFDPNVPHKTTDACFFHSYSVLSSDGGLGVAVHFQILFTQKVGSFFSWDTSATPKYPGFTISKVLGGYSDGRPFRQSGTVYSTNLFPESVMASYPPTAGEWSIQYGGFHGCVTGDAGVDRAWITIIPYWSLIVAWGLITWFPVRQQIRIWRDRKRAQIGKCRICGYDLRATPERCPECGAVPSI